VRTGMGVKSKGEDGRKSTGGWRKVDDGQVGCEVDVVVSSFVCLLFFYFFIFLLERVTRFNLFVLFAEKKNKNTTHILSERRVIYD
jgi:hypothetical protein